MNSTGTITSTFTVADVRKVLENFAADFSMMSLATGLRSRENVEQTVSDIRAFAEDGYLVEVKLILRNGQGVKIRGASYKVSESAAGWSSDRPGNNLWPYTPNGSLSVIVTLSYRWYQKTAEQQADYKRSRGFYWSWDPTTEDTSFSGLTATAAQRYASGTYGWQRANYS
jgi:hypothetical protein